MELGDYKEGAHTAACDFDWSADGDIFEPHVPEKEARKMEDPFHTSETSSAEFPTHKEGEHAAADYDVDWSADGDIFRVLIEGEKTHCCRKSKCRFGETVSWEL